MSFFEITLLNIWFIMYGRKVMGINNVTTIQNMIMNLHRVKTNRNTSFGENNREMK